MINLRPDKHSSEFLDSTSRREFLRVMTIAGSAAVASFLSPSLRSNVLLASSILRSPESRFMTINGLKLHFLDWGNANAQPLVLLHSANLNAHAWDSFARAMSPYFHVIAPDARGFGESQWAASYETDMFVADLHGLITELDLKHVILCGNSLGGTSAMAYVSAYPANIDRLILVDTGPGPKPGTQRPLPPAGRPSGPPQIPAGPFRSVDDAMSQLVAAGGPTFARIVAHENLKRESPDVWRWKFDHAGTAGGFQRSMADPRRWPRWLSINVPTLVLRGERSPALSQAAAEEMIRERPNATLIVIPDAGHFIAVEQPDAFEKAVRAWLRV